MQEAGERWQSVLADIGQLPGGPGALLGLREPWCVLYVLPIPVTLTSSTEVSALGFSCS